MSDIKNKFVITQDKKLIIGRCIFHKELDENPVGGGSWYYESETNRLFLWGKSQDFGRVTQQEVNKSELQGSIGRSDPPVEIVFEQDENLEAYEVLHSHMSYKVATIACQCGFL